jgi:hypothetical protein
MSDSGIRYEYSSLVRRYIKAKQDFMNINALTEVGTAEDITELYEVTKEKMARLVLEMWEIGMIKLME